MIDLYKCISCNSGMFETDRDYYSDNAEYSNLDCANCHYYHMIGPITFENYSEARIVRQIYGKNIFAYWSVSNNRITIKTRQNQLFACKSLTPFTKEWIDTIYSKYLKLKVFL